MAYYEEAYDFPLDCSFGEWLRVTMFLRVLSTEELAKRAIDIQIGLQEWTDDERPSQIEKFNTKIVHVLNHRKQPTWPFCNAIAVAMRLSSVEFFRHAELLPRPTALIQQISQAFQGLNEEDQKEFLLFQELSFPTDPLPLNALSQQDKEELSLSSESGSAIGQPVPVDFAEWLGLQLKRRAWNMSTPRKWGGPSHTTMQSIINKKIRPSWDCCLKIATALQIPPSEVFFAAGLLDSEERGTLSRFRNRIFLLDEVHQRSLLHLIQRTKTSYSIPSIP